MSQITILDQGNTPMGPFTREQVTEKLQRGEVTMSSLAFVEGLSQWTPLRDVLGRMDAVASPVVGMPPAPATGVPGYSYAATMQPPGHFVYAGFWLRFAAVLVDSLVLSPLVIIYLVLNAALSATISDRGTDPAVAFERLGLALGVLVYLLIMVIAIWLYFALLESGPRQATLGKRALCIRVTSLDGQRISFGRATGRYFAKWISHIILYIGFIMAGFTERKQALHDMMAGTLVVRN